MLKKLGSNAYPFFFELPPHCPASVTLQPAPGDMGKPCGVDYELKCFVGETHEDKPHKRYFNYTLSFFFLMWLLEGRRALKSRRSLPNFGRTTNIQLILFCRNSVRLAIRKIMYAPSKQGEQPSVEVSKEFMMSPNKLHLEASLDKELYYHGETIAVNVHIQNNSNKSVKKVKVSGKFFQSQVTLLFFFFL